MCGITGVIQYDRDLTELNGVVEHMTEVITRRGPDDTGIIKEQHALLGHRRLVVVDPTGGAQPMKKSVNGNTYTIVYNGELYNTEELRKQLLKLGLSFRSYSDTEVLLCAYIAWGEDCVKKLNGIFSFGVWNASTQTLFLCRDPLGVKPLYYARKDGAFLFGSEIKAILAYPKMRAELDAEGILELIGLGPAHTPSSGVLKGVFQLPAAHYLVYTRDGLRVEEYWKPNSTKHEKTPEEVAYEVRELLNDAVVRQLTADVPVGTFLSGGLDSSIISAVAAKEFEKKGERLHTFSVEYQDNADFYKKSDFMPDADEVWADKMASHINSLHTKVILDNTNLADALFDAVIANDMPGMADIDSSLLLFCREIKKTTTVALSGECADEIFGGYPWYVRPDLAYENTFPWSGAIMEREALLTPRLKSLGLPDYVEERYQKTVNAALLSGDESPADVKHKVMFYLNLKWFMQTLLTRKDRMSMFSALEVRVPFADHRLVEYAYNIPREMLFYGDREKGLLRTAMKGILPEDILWRKKSPYPKTFHPAYTFRVTEKLRSYLNDKEVRLLEFLDVDSIKALVETEGRSFTRPWFGQLMTGPQLIAYLVQLEYWLRAYDVNVRL
ncbi:MAG TPA: asparagine synthase (glutamine-hydrolyzing) [Clostridia bacterium]|nr:asparagine synthase (glutamine-hydrolyzing) [Clostridia bacterium]